MDLEAILSSLFVLFLIMIGHNFQDIIVKKNKKNWLLIILPL